MRAQLEVHASDPAVPERAALELTRSLLTSFPRRRPVTLVLVGFAPHPGLTPTPWALEGVLTACVEAERTPLNLLSLAHPDTCEALLRKAGSGSDCMGGVDVRELVERPSRDRSLGLRGNQAKPFTIPRELIGSSLIVLAPMLVRAREHNGARQWQGPIGLALEQLALAWGYTRSAPRLGGLKPAPDDSREATAAGLELIAASFASAAVILDATWAGALEQARPVSPIGHSADPQGSEPARLLGELASPDRQLALAHLERLELDAVLGVDQWLGKTLGLSRSATLDLPAPIVSSQPSGAEHRWPPLTVTDPRPQPTKLADRAISGIRSQSKRLAGGLAGLTQAAPREFAALPARVPGRFAAHWTARWYAEHDRIRP